MSKNLRYFLIGGLIAAVPMFFYGYIRLKPAQSTQSKPLKTKLQREVNESLKIPEYKISEELKVEFKTQTLFWTNDLTKIPYGKVPKSNIVFGTSRPKAQVIEKKQTAIYEVRTPTVPSDITRLIEKYAGEYGVNKDMMIHIAKCESGFRSNAVNGPYAGIYQFVATTWISNRRAMGLDENPQLRFNAEESVRTAAFKMSRDGFGAWPVCHAKARKLLTANGLN